MTYYYRLNKALIFHTHTQTRFNNPDDLFSGVGEPGKFRMVWQENTYL